MNVYEQIFKKYGLSPTQQEILEIVGYKKTVLEIGSSTGYMTKAFLDNGCTIDVVELDKKAVAKLPKKVRKVFNLPVEDDGLYKDFADYDFIIMADVLEHLVRPELVLEKLYKASTADTKLLISVPNIASWGMRKQLFFKGDFRYQESGLLDKTHLHFYTVETLPEALKGSGWKVLEILGTITRLPFEGLTGRIPLLYSWLVRRYKNLAYYHFLIEASKK